MEQQQLKKRCLKHPNQYISFLRINSETKQYDLACQRCLSMVNGNLHLFNINDMLNQQEEILYNWPLTKKENNFDEMLQILDNFSSDEFQKKISEKIKKMRSTFDSEITKLEKNLIQLSSNQIYVQFQQKYKQAAQIDQLIQHIKEELIQDNKGNSFSVQFKEFVRRQIESNHVENLLNYLKASQEKQEQHLQKFDQIVVSLQKIFQEPQNETKLESKKQQNDQVSNKLQQEVKDLNSQIESLKKSCQTERNLKEQQTANLLYRIDEINNMKEEKSKLVKQNYDLQKQLEQQIKENNLLQSQQSQHVLQPKFGDRFFNQGNQNISQRDEFQI